MTSLTITGGLGTCAPFECFDGGGIANLGGNLAILRSTVSGNFAFAGGGILNGDGATLTLTDSTVRTTAQTRPVGSTTTLVTSPSTEPPR